MRPIDRRRALLGLALAAAAPMRRASGAADIEVDTVSFPCLDGRTKLVGFLFKAAGGPAGQRRPGMVLLHGRAGPYSSLAKGRYTADTLSMRHKMWARHWAGRGGVALLVDSFGPRGYPAGFAAHTYDERPDAVNEVTVRPLDAYGGLRYLAGRVEIDPRRIGLQGWSNGGSATLATMAEPTRERAGVAKADAFRGALAFYPGCGLQNAFASGYRPYAPVRIFIGTEDEEVSPKLCAGLVEESEAAGREIALALYRDAQHDFDDPGKKRQSVAANVAAKEDAMRQATAFMVSRIGI
jgi:carboxymethylenebutenolidase